MEKTRCRWCMGDSLMIAYHDEEWGVRQLHDDRALFEFLTLEAMQCGLSWRTVLYKREAMRAAFDNFDPYVIAGYDEEKIAKVMQAPGIIHSEGKIRAMVNNARMFIEIAAEFGSFDEWFWSFTGGKTVVYPENIENMPAKNELSEKISAKMRGRGFKYMGPVVVYSYMQATGMVNDHEKGCYLCGIKAEGE